MKNKSLKILSLVTTALSIVLTGVVVVMAKPDARHDPGPVQLQAEIRPQNIASALEDILYIPGTMPDGMEPAELKYSAGPDDPGFMCLYRDSKGGWYEIGITVSPVSSDYTYKEDKSVSGSLIAYYTAGDDNKMNVYQVDGVGYYVRGNIPESDLDGIMDGYIKFIGHKQIA